MEPALTNNSSDLGLARRVSFWGASQREWTQVAVPLTVSTKRNEVGSSPVTHPF